MTIDDEELDGATRAFEALQAEIAGLRRSVEGLEPALREERGPDYSPTLGALAASLEAVATRLELIERHTGAMLPVEVARREIARVYDASLRPARSDLERATHEVQDAARNLQGTIGRARSRREQRASLMRIATLAGVAGLMAFPLLVFPLTRALPFGGELPDDLAASVLGVDRWTAGAGLMSRADPGRWSDFVQGYAAAHAAGDDLKICFDAAKKAGRGQRCTITVDPSSPGH